MPGQFCGKWWVKSIWLRLCLSRKWWVESILLNGVRLLLGGSAGGAALKLEANQIATTDSERLRR